MVGTHDGPSCLPFQDFEKSNEDDRGSGGPKIGAMEGIGYVKSKEEKVA